MKHYYPLFKKSSTFVIASALIALQFIGASFAFAASIPPTDSQDPNAILTPSVLAPLKPYVAPLPPGSPLRTEAVPNSAVTNPVVPNPVVDIKIPINQIGRAHV